MNVIVKAISFIVMKLKSIKNIINARNGIVAILMLLFFVLLVEDLYSNPRNNRRSTAKKRTYNPERTKAHALAVLQTSDALTELAKIESRDTKEGLAYISSGYENLENPQELLVENTSTRNTTSTKNISIEELKNGMSDVELLKTFLADTDNDYEFIDDDEFGEGEFGEDIAELEAEDDVKVELDFRSIWLLAIGGSGAGDGTLLTSYGVDKELLMGLIMDWLGTPYRFGGATRKAIDCSAWIRAVFYQADSIILPRTAREQVHLGHRVSRNKLEFGDLVFFHTYSRRFASHVGIYLGDNLFAHASSVAGVTISSLNSTYYSKRFIGGRRFSASDYASYKTAATRK